MLISRRDLYNRVWSTPMIKLARELDISDVGIAKACRRHNIPRPPRGFWAKAAAGRVPPKPPLPPAKVDMVRLEPVRHRIPIRPKLEVDKVATRAAMESDALAGTAAATLERLTSTKLSKDGFVTCGSSKVISCSLSPATVQRACRILGTIERSMDAVGARFVHNTEAKRVEIAIGGERLGISISENYTRTESVTIDPKLPWMKSRTFTYHFSGELRLSIAGDFAGRKIWTDGKRSTLEDKTDSILSGIATAARAISQLRAEREEQRRRWAEAEREAEIARERQRRLRHFAEQLRKEADAWHRYCEVKAYVEHLQSQITARDVLPEQSREWLRLATHLARLTDPTKARVESLLAGISDNDYYLPFGRTIAP